MNLIKKIKSLQEDKQTFEKEINDKYLIQHKENIGYIFLTSTFIFSSAFTLFFLNSSFTITLFLTFFYLFIFTNMINKYFYLFDYLEKRISSFFLKENVRKKIEIIFVIIFFVSLLLLMLIPITFLMETASKNGIGADYTLCIYSLLGCAVFCLLIFVIGFLFDKMVQNKYFDKKLDNFIDEKRVEIFNEYFKFKDISLKNQEKINYIKKICENLMLLEHPDSQDAFFKELVLLENLKESNLDYTIKENSELYQLLEEKVKSRSYHNLLNDLIDNGWEFSLHLNNEFNEVFKEYQNFIQINQKYLLEENPFYFNKKSFNDLIEKEAQMFQEWKKVDAQNINKELIEGIKTKMDLINKDKKQIIDELKAKHQETKEYVENKIIQNIK